MGYKEMKDIQFTWDAAIAKCQSLKSQGYKCTQLSDGFLLINDDLMQMIFVMVRTPNKRGKMSK